MSSTRLSRRSLSPSCPCRLCRRCFRASASGSSVAGPRGLSRPRDTSGDPPRLILRFAVSTCAALALAAAAILLVVRYYNTVQAERAATSQARVLASAVLRGSLVPADFEQRVPAPRRGKLDELFATRVLAEGFLLATIHKRDGSVTYSTDHRHRATPDAAAHVREARS